MADKTIGRALRSPAIPTLGANNLPEVVESIVRWIQAREGRLGDGLDRAVTFRDVDLLNLTDADSLRRVAGGKRALTTPVSAPDGVALPPDDTPPAPTDLRAFGAISNVIVTWKMATFAAFDYFELWRAPIDALGSAVLVLTTAAPIAADQPPSGSTVYYWVRARSIYGRTGPYNAVAGVPATLALNPADLLAALDGQIRESHLYRTLATPIRSILSNADDASEEALAAVLAAHAAARRAKQDLLLEAASRGTAITQTRTLVDQGDAQLASQITTLSAVVTSGLNAALAAIETEETARADGDEAEATERTTLAVQLRGGYSGTDLGSLTSGLLFSERQARAAVDTAHSGRLDTLESTATDLAGDITANATAIDIVETEVFTGANRNSALSTRISGLETSVDNPTTGLLHRAGQLETQVADANADIGALTTRTTTLEARVEAPSATPGSNYNPTWASLQTTQGAFATLDGRANTAYTVRTTVSSGGRTVAGGFGLMGNSAAAPGTEIEFGILASRFWVGAPSGTGISDSQLFTIQTIPWLDNGVSRPAGVFIDAAYIKNLVVLYATIQQLVADDIVAASISVAQLTAGSIGVGSYIQSTGFLAGSGGTAGFGFRISGNGDAEFNNAIFRGTIYATAGAIGGIVLQSNHIRNSGYSAGTSGFRINSDGSAEFNNVTVRGTVYASAGEFAGALSGATGTFAGSLTAATGTLGALTIAAGGNVKAGQTAYNTGTGFYLGIDSGTPRFSIGNPASTNMRWDGTDLFINTPTFESFSASISGGTVTTGGASRTVTVSGGKPGYSYNWVYQSTSGIVCLVHLANVSTATVTVNGVAGADGSASGVLTCMVKDANGRVTFASVSVSLTFSSGAGGGPD